ncbi:DUF4389 domain-containing protein [Ilumatobacter sp.]|nr:DUF4389 domain-containing protein [Ilumatobacter sp.]MDG1391421.1 DUF4389 domain-containing protein [Ilumatobacter sp.]
MTNDGSTPFSPPAPPPPPPPPQAGGPGAVPPGPAYPARFDVRYPEQLSRVTTAFRLILVIPIAILLSVLSGSGTQVTQTAGGEWVMTSTASVASALFGATLLMILFRKRYPRWWFDFNLELTRFTARVGVYMALLTDEYPSTVDAQSVALDIDYPDAEHDLRRGLPLVKWFLAIPHYIVLFFLAIGAFFAVIAAWFAILFTGRYPRGLFNFVVGVGRWGMRVNAYAFLLTTDQYPPRSHFADRSPQPTVCAPATCRRRRFLGAQTTDLSDRMGA